MGLTQDIQKFLKELSKNHQLFPYLYSANQESFDPQKDWVYYSGPLWDSDETTAMIEALLTGKWLPSGENVARFEREFAKGCGDKAAVMVNSGSSANLVMVAALKKFFEWQDGDEVIVSPVGFPTTIAPVIQNGLKPVFVDIEMQSLNFNVSQISKKLSPKTKAIFISPVLGNPPDMELLQEIANKNELKLILDGCDSLGTQWGDQHLNELCEASSCSFYPAHHISTAEGGMVSSRHKDLVATARSMAWWGRDCYCVGKANLLPQGTCQKRFGPWLDNFNGVVDHKYVFTNLGYNLKPLDFQGAIGVEQLKKLPTIHKKRREHKERLQKALQQIPGTHIPQELESAKTSWFGIPIVCKTQDLKEQLVKHFEDHHVQTRNYFAGNILLHPAYKDLDDHQKYPNANEVLKRVFFIGCSPTYRDCHLEWVEKVCSLKSD